MTESFFSANRVVAASDGKRVARAGGGKRLETEVSEKTGRADVPWIGNDKRAVARVQRVEEFAFFLEGGHRGYFVGGRVEGMPKVPSTTSTKFLSSRRMKRLVCAMAKFSRASGSDFKRAL